MSRPLPGVRLGCSEPIWPLHKTVTPQAQYKGFPQAVGERLECWAARTLWAWAHKDRQAIDCLTSPPGAKPQTQAVSVDHADRAADTVHFCPGTVVGGHTLQLEEQAETTGSRPHAGTTPSTARLDSHWKHEAKDEASRSSQAGIQ